MKFLIYYSSLLILGSLIINGFYEITRKGMVFGFWEEFWEKFTQNPEYSEPKYRFSKWIRFPISACITCFSSIYGSIVFWTSIYLINQNLFWWTNYPLIALLLTWVSYCISLAYLNQFFHNKINTK